jgi:hypothetical protein
MGEGFWHFDIGNVITAAVAAIGILGAVWRFGRKVDLIADSGRQNTERIEGYKVALTEMVATMRNIDTHGTQWSQRGLTLESELTKSNARRLDNHDAILATVPSSLARMETDVHWIKEYCMRDRRSSSEEHPGS